MNVYDAAHQLARSITEADEYKQFRKLEADVMANASLKAMVEDFQRKQFELQGEVLQGKQPDEDKVKKLEELFAIATKDPKAAEYFQVKMRFDQMMGDVSKILGDAMGVADEE